MTIIFAVFINSVTTEQYSEILNFYFVCNYLFLKHRELLKVSPIRKTTDRALTLQ